MNEPNQPPSSEPKAFPRIYTASKVCYADSWRALRARGMNITASWIDEAGEGESKSYAELSERCISDIRGSTHLILYCRKDDLLKGALIEAGVALALSIPVVCINDCPGISRVFRMHPLWSEHADITAAIQFIALDWNRRRAPQPETAQERPRIICLCGSSKFPDAHMRVMMEETLAGRIVIPMGLYGHADFPAGARAATNDADESTEVKQMLDRLHFARIDAADEILVVTVGDYIGSSTKREIAHATETGKTIRYRDIPETAPAPESAETPETDAAQLQGIDRNDDQRPVTAKFARKLERQRDAALARVRVLETALDRLIEQCDKTDWMGVAGEMDAVLDDSRKALQL